MRFNVIKKRKVIARFGIACSLIFVVIFISFSPLVSASNYSLALTKGTKYLVVDQYNETAWQNTVNISSSPNDWFEGEADIIGAKSKILTRGWNLDIWNAYDGFVSIFLPMFFELEEIFTLLNLLESQGYNETTINNNYTYSYFLWYGIQSVWNFTGGEFKENPSTTDNQIFIFRDPSDLLHILEDYNQLSAKLNNNTIITMSGFNFPILEPDEFLWHLIFEGLALARPFNAYLDGIVSSLGCKNATVNGNTLIIDRIGETNYNIEFTYDSRGTLSNISVNNNSGERIFHILSTNSDWIFYTILVTVGLLSVGIIVLLILKHRKIKRT